MPIYSPLAWERAMKLHAVIAEAIAGKTTWLQAADLLGMSPRTVRRWRARMEKYDIEGLKDRRMLSPSGKAIKPSELADWLRLYRTRYRGFTARHFWSIGRRKHGLTWSYTLIREALQRAGLVRRHRPRGRHFRRREPRGCFGEMLHLDGSRHRWLALRPADYQHLIVVVDDATRRILYAQLTEHESTNAVFDALDVVSCYIYELPTHHCPFCILQKEYGYIGYLIYVTLLGGAIAGLSVGVLMPFGGMKSLSEILPRFQRSLAITSSTFFIVFTAIVTVRILFSGLVMDTY